MYTSKSFSCTHHNHLLTIYLLSVIYDFYLCVKMTVYSPSLHFFPSKQWASAWFVWKEPLLDHGYLTMAVWNINFPISIIKWCSLSPAMDNPCGGNGHWWQYFPSEWLLQPLITSGRHAYVDLLHIMPSYFPLRVLQNTYDGVILHCLVGNAAEICSTMAKWEWTATLIFADL